MMFTFVVNNLILRVCSANFVVFSGASAKHFFIFLPSFVWSFAHHNSPEVHASSLDEVSSIIAIAVLDDPRPLYQ